MKDTKDIRTLATRIRKGNSCSDAEREIIADLLEWNDGVGHPDDVEPLAFALGGMHPNGTAEQRFALAAMLHDEVNHREALRAAQNGNPRKVMERQQQGKRVEMPFIKRRGRPSTRGSRIEAFIWLTKVEGESRKDAIDTIQKAEKSNTQSTAVEREIDKKKDGFKPDFWFEICAQRWLEGCRDDDLRPLLLRTK